MIDLSAVNMSSIFAQTRAQFTKLKQVDDVSHRMMTSENCMPFILISLFDKLAVQILSVTDKKVTDGSQLIRMDCIKDDKRDCE